MPPKREDLIRHIFEHSEAMKRGMYSSLQAYFHKMPISRAQLEVLSAIGYLQPVSSKEVARQLYLTPGAVSQSVELLHSQGYVLRKSDPDDRRIQHLQLSKKGDKTLQDVKRRRQSMLEQAMRDLTIEELTLWLKVQTKLSEQYQALSTHTTVKHNK